MKKNKNYQNIINHLYSREFTINMTENVANRVNLGKLVIYSIKEYSKTFQASSKFRCMMVDGLEGVCLPNFVCFGLICFLVVLRTTILSIFTIFGGCSAHWIKRDGKFVECWSAK